MLLTTLLVILVLDCIALVAVVLMQRSEGGALGMGGGPTGMFTARGAGDLLTKMTWILGWTFFILAFLITLLSGIERSSSVVDSIDPDATAPLTVPVAPPAGQQPGAQPLPQSAPPPLPGQAPAPDAAPPLPQAAPAPAPTSTTTPPTQNP
jgi:preprotein translocase subunit SecG